MTDFDKQKIAFTVALLAVLLLFHPILNHVGESGFTFFQWFLSVSQLYYCVSGLFAISVYAFGLRLLTDKGARYISIVGPGRKLTTTWLTPHGYRSQGKTEWQA